jgi:hypothetical protein
MNMEESGIEDLEAKNEMIKDLEAKINSNYYVAMITQINEEAERSPEYGTLHCDKPDQIHPVKIVDIIAREGDQRYHLYIAHTLNKVDGETKKLIERGVPREQVIRDWDDALSSTGLQATHPEVQLNQMCHLLKYDGYMPVSESLFKGTRVRFLRAPCDKMDKFKEGYREVINII